MKTILTQILQEISILSKGQSKLSEDMTEVIQRLDIIDNKLNVIQDIAMTNSKFAVALSSDIMQCASRESIATLDTKLDLLNDRVFQQETKLKLIETR